MNTSSIVSEEVLVSPHSSAFPHHHLSNISFISISIIQIQVQTELERELTSNTTHNERLNRKPPTLPSYSA